MKYIKKYKLFESIHPNDAIRDTIDDILSPLSDDGIVVDTQPKEKRGVMTGIEIYILKNGNSDGFKLTPFLDELNHLNDFLEDQGWVLNSDPTVSDREYDFDKWIDNVKKSENTYNSVPLFYVPKQNDRENVISDLVNDTVIDYDKEEITFPFMGSYDPILPLTYPFTHLTPYHYICLSDSPRRKNEYPVPPFIRYCRSKYGVKEEEMVYLWDQYKREILKFGGANLLTGNYYDTPPI